MVDVLIENGFQNGERKPLWMPKESKPEEKLVQPEQPRKRQYFTGINCQSCIYKGSSYCWNSCCFNIWKKE